MQAWDARPKPINKGDDVVVLARRALDYGDENACRLLSARCAVDQQNIFYATGEPAPSSLPECQVLASLKAEAAKQQIFVSAKDCAGAWRSMQQ